MNTTNEAGRVRRERGTRRLLRDGELIWVLPFEPGRGYVLVDGRPNPWVVFQWSA